MIEVKNLSKIYKTKKGVSVKALDNINFTLEDIGLIFILGKSGSGKTTLLNLLGGLDNYDEGEILIKGRSTRDFTQSEFDSFRNTFIGFVFQEYNILNDFTVVKNIEIALELQGLPRNQNKIVDILKQIDLEGFTNREPCELSTGQKQRIAIARALIKSPDLILADEPTGALDTKTGKQIIEILKSVSKEKLVVVVTHDRKMAEIYGDRVIEIADGKIINDNKHDVKVKTYKPEEFRLIKSKLPFKSSFIMGANSIKHKPFRFMLTIFLAMFSFALFAVTDTFANYNENKVILNSMKESQLNYVSFSKEKIYNCDYDRCMYSPKFTDDDITMFKEKFSGYDFIPVFKQLNKSFGDTIYDNLRNRIDKEGWFYYDESIKFNGGVELTQEILDDFNFELIAGDLPKDEYDIVLSKYTYNVFHKYGYKSPIDGTKIEIESPYDLIGKTLIMNEYNFNIAGIIDTNFNEERYHILFERKKDEYSYDLKDRLIKYEFEYSLKYGFHNLAFVSSEFYDESAKSPEGTFVIGLDEEPIYLDYQSISISFDDYIQQYYQFSRTIPQNVFWNDGFNRTELQDNEIIIPLDLLPNQSKIDNFPIFDVLLNQTKIELIDNFVEEHFSEIENEFGSNKNGYYNYILEGGRNQFHEGKDLSYFEHIATQKVLNEVYFPIYQNISLQNKYESEISDYPVKIVGFSYNSDQSNKPTVITSKNIYDLIREKCEDDYKTLFTALKGEENKDIRLIDFGKITWGTKKIGTNYPIINEITSTVDYANRTLDKISDMALFIAIILALFSIILLFNFINVSIGSMKKEIGILRALGARGKDIFMIFINESLIISLVSFIFAIILAFSTTIYLNNILKTDYQLLISLLAFGKRQVLLVFFITIFVALIGSFLPVFSLARKKPIEVIKPT